MEQNMKSLAVCVCARARKGFWGQDLSKTFAIEARFKWDTNSQ